MRIKYPKAIADKASLSAFIALLVKNPSLTKNVIM